MSILKLLVIAVLLACVTAELVNEDVTRVIDLRTHLVKVTTTVILKNDKSGPVSTFRFTVDPSHAKHLAYIAFTKVGSLIDYNNNLLLLGLFFLLINSLTNFIYMIKLLFNQLYKVFYVL